MKARALVSGAAALLLVAAAACGGKPTPPDEGPPDGDTGEGRGSDHALGPQGAPVLLVEYADFQ